MAGWMCVRRHKHHAHTMGCKQIQAAHLIEKSTVIDIAAQLRKLVLQDLFELQTARLLVPSHVILSHVIPSHVIPPQAPLKRRGMQSATCMIFSTLGPQYASTCRHSTMLRLSRGSLTRSGRRSTEVISAMQSSVRQRAKTMAGRVARCTCLKSSNAAILFAAEYTAGCQRRERFRQGCHRLNSALPIVDA